MCVPCATKQSAANSLEARKKTLLERYGYDNPQKIKLFNERRKQTVLEKYGVTSPAQLEKSKQTNINKHGAEYALQAPNIRETIKQNNLEKYGVENPIKLPDIREKIEKTNLAKYGVRLPFQSNDIQAKIKDTVLKKYGSEYFCTSDHFRELKTQNNWFTSKAELEIFDFITNLGFSPRKYYIENTEIDIYVSEMKIGIEYNGLYWHCELHKNKQYHLNKTKLAEKNGIKLVHIFEHEWRDRQEQVKSRLRSLLKLNKSIYARKLEVREVGWDQTKDFINKTHIQPIHSKPLKTFGLFNGSGELMCLATFSLHHRNNSELVLSRFCCQDGFTIVGGLSKLSKHASNYFEKDIVSWCDIRWSDGNGYEKTGWIRDLINKPDYFYTDGLNVIPKQARMKSKVNTPAGMTEHQHSLMDGLYRVWDCGKIRYVYLYNKSKTCDLIDCSKIKDG